MNRLSFYGTSMAISPTGEHQYILGIGRDEHMCSALVVREALETS